MDEKTALAFYDHLSLQGKCSILISYVFFKGFQDFSRLLHLFLFSRTFPGLEIQFFVFQVFKVFKVFQGEWEPCKGLKF